MTSRPFIPAQVAESPAYYQPEAVPAVTGRDELHAFIDMMGMPTDVNSIIDHNSFNRWRHTAPQQTSTPLLRALVGAGVGVSLASVYYAYTRYQKYRLQTQLDNLQWSVRQWTNDDVEDVSNQIFHAFDDNIRAGNRNGTSSITRPFWRREVEFLLQTKQRGLVAVDDSNGTIIGSVFGDESDEDIVTLGPFSVLTKYADHGIARKLVQQLIDECLQHNPQRCMILTQSPKNAKAFALYSRLGFRARFSLLHMTGYAKPETASSSSDIQVERLTQKDVDEAVELLKTTLCGINRPSYIKNMLNPSINTHGVGHVARSKSDNKLIGFTTSANTVAGIWCYSSVDAFKALYLHASNDLRSYEDEKNYMVSVWLPMPCYNEFRWLLTIGARLQGQINTMTINAFNIRSTLR